MTQKVHLGEGKDSKRGILTKTERKHERGQDTFGQLWAFPFHMNVRTGEGTGGLRSLCLFQMLVLASVNEEESLKIWR